MNDDQANAVLEAVTNLAVTVRDEGPDAVRVAVNEVLAAASGDVYAALTIAAALVRIDAPIDPWWEKPARGPLIPCGTHAAFNRHRDNDEEPCDKCWTAQRIYDRDRKRRQRARAA